MSALRLLDLHPQLVVTEPTTIESRIGNTPLVGFRRVNAHLPANVQVYAKAEWYNPGGSIKDRAALNIILNAERNGSLDGSKILMDSTSGNTGIAYAMIGAARGHRVKLFLPENVSRERVAILRAYGVDLTFTDPLEGSDGAIQAVRELAAAEPDRYYYADQYNNAANWQAHYNSTAPEIWKQTHGQVTHFVAGLGTTGTLVGTGRRLHEYNTNIQVVAMQPDSPFHGLEGLKHIPTAIRPGIYDEKVADRQVTVNTEAAHHMARRLAREEGYLVGISAAANLVAALRIGEEVAERGDSATIVTIFCDNGYKYLSEKFWQA
ncbi:MAG: PLP-dependent cysteine synthase family protein [Phototrophicaceae bacterium]